MTWEEFWIFITRYKVGTGYEDWTDAGSLIEIALNWASYITTPLGIGITLLLCIILNWIIKHR